MDLTRAARGRRVLFALLYFAEGAPIGFIWWAVPTRLREAGEFLQTLRQVLRRRETGLGIALALTASAYALFMQLTDPRLGATQFSAYMGAINGCEAWGPSTADKALAPPAASAHPRQAARR